ncbi:hypothetical protein DXG01_001448 [Tephrocybe rancida]|nr:hypothetical protein DXG01_001448 [Tephrocybe rancida]
MSRCSWTLHKFYRDPNFDIITSGEEGSCSLPGLDTKNTDRPLIVQFCANSPKQLLAAAKLVEARCDAIDIDLGCPQEIARRGRYGAFLMDDWELVYNMITVKFRVFKDIERRVAYAQMLEDAWDQILICHSCTCEQRGQNSALASYEHIRAIKAAVSVSVFANGNILFSSDNPRCLAETGVDSLMSAEGVFYNPALFSASSLLDETNPPLADLTLEYLAILRSQPTRTAPSAVRGHLFKILRLALRREAYWDLRERLGRVRAPAAKRSADAEEDRAWVEEYLEICQEAKTRLIVDAEEATQGGRIPVRDLVTTDCDTGLEVLLHWLAQPYFRPPPPTAGKSNNSEPPLPSVLVVSP